MLAAEQLALVGFPLAVVALLVLSAARMVICRNISSVKARCVNFVVAHTTVAVLWVSMSALRGLYSPASACRWPLDFVQYGVLQSTWVAIWVLRIAMLERALHHRIPRIRDITVGFVSIYGLSIVTLLDGILTAGCGTTLRVDALVATTAVVHLAVLHAAIIRYRRLPAPLRVSPEAEWCSFVAFFMLVVVAFGIGTAGETVARRVLAPIMVGWVTLAWQYVQCKPVLIARDETFDDVMQSMSSEDTALLVRMNETTDERLDSFLAFCRPRYPLTVNMIVELRKDTTVAVNITSDTQRLHTIRYFTSHCFHNMLANSHFVGDEIEIPAAVQVGPAINLREYAFEFLVKHHAGAYETECANRVRVVATLDGSKYHHPAHDAYYP